jgi:hypothetical protein
MQVATRFVPELSWKERELPQKERTKHVHGIHPYLGKYVPQLVDYLLARYFKTGDNILDPFVGSGTTLVEANVGNMGGVGVDVSEFNILLCRVKLAEYNLPELKREFSDIVHRVKLEVKAQDADTSLDAFLSENPVGAKRVGPDVKEASVYLRTWYHPNALYPLLVFRNLIGRYWYQDALKVLLSRVARSSRLAPHYELDFPKRPFTKDYYCYKHARTCHPTTNALGFMERYCIDTYNRIAEFQSVRTDSPTELILGDLREAELPRTSGVITSPPYVGLIDYHEQHRYAYELLGLVDRSELEIGAKRNRDNEKAREAYKAGIVTSLKHIADQSTDGPIIFVVNDRHKLYEDICSDAGLNIAERMSRRVDRRTGRRSNGEFYEDILVMKT